MSLSNGLSNGPGETNSPNQVDPFAPGSQVYIRVNILDPNALWIKAQIIKFLQADQLLVEGSFAIKDDGSVVKTTGSTERLVVSKKNIASYNATTNVLPVRSHVLAALASGIIAEKPRRENGHRYLIFFECGTVGYYDPSDVHEVANGLFDLETCDSQISIHYKVFLQDYFARYPVRIPIDHTVGGTIEFNVGTYDNPIWSEARIIEIDASCITIDIKSSKDREKFTQETIYKASPKIKRIYNFINYYITKFGKFIPSITLPTAETKDEPSSNGQKPFSLAIPRRRRTIRAASNTTKPIATGNKWPLDIDLPAKGEKFFSFIKQLKMPNFSPFFSPHGHECNSTCIQIKPDLLALRGLNHFLFPIHFGFKRIEAAETIFYIGPCGLVMKTLEQIHEYLTSTKCVLDIDDFTFEPISTTNEAIESPLQCIHYELDISHGEEFQPISLINFYEETKLTPEFVYESKRSLVPKLKKILDEPFVSCCDCKDNCNNPETCSCIQMTIKNEFHQKHQESDCHGYSSKRLDRPNKFGIYECNSRCPCNSYCSNRVVQNGIKCSLQVFMTRPDLGKGWGVRALYDIPKGTFVCTYSGKVMPDEAASEFDFYTASLDFIECTEELKEGFEHSTSEDNESGCFSSNSSSSSLNEQSISPVNERTEPTPRPQVECEGANGYSLRRRKSAPEGAKASKKNSKPKPLRSLLQMKEPLVVSSQKFGNVGRFINHSCEPNLFIQNVFIETHDLRLPHVALFTNRTVHAMEELTWDYNYEIGCIPGRVVVCHCGSDLCRGRLL